MTQFKQQADCNFYYMGDNDQSLDRDILIEAELVGRNHPNADEIMTLMLESYRSEDLPSNGSIDGYVRGKLSHNPDTRDLAEQAKNPPNMWQTMSLAYQGNIRKLARWVGGYSPVTKDSIRFDTKLSLTKDRMRACPVYAKKLAKRWELLKMCNKSLA